MENNGPSREDPKTITICLVGDNKVGKTTFLSRISQRTNLHGRVTITPLDDQDQPFVFELRRGSKEYRLEFFDTSAPIGWQNIDPDLVIICYDISQRISLLNLTRIWINEVKLNFENDYLPIAVLGLKRDLRSDTAPNGTIYPQEATGVAQQMRADSYMECSAVTGELLELVVKDIFSLAVRTTSEAGAQSDGGCMVI